MRLLQPLDSLLSMLLSALHELTIDQYVQPIPVLSGATIGQHTRHILEFFMELNKGYLCGTVDYDQRKRNHAIESDHVIATTQLLLILRGLSQPDKALVLRVDYGGENAAVEIKTNYYRELVYNLEHTVHHMALIRIGINAVSAIQLPLEFGVASSTLKSRTVCAQ